MNPTWTKVFQAIIGTEEALLPVFVHNPKSQTIAAVIVATEVAVGQIFGIAPPASAGSTSN